MKKRKLSAGWEFCLDERTSKEETAPESRCSICLREDVEPECISHIAILRR